MSDKLKPCPFCGKGPEAAGLGFGPIREDEVLGIRIVQCKSCFAIVSCNTEAEAVNLWNTRPVEDKLQAEIDRLEGTMNSLVFDKMCCTCAGNIRRIRDAEKAKESL